VNQNPQIIRADTLTRHNIVRGCYMMNNVKETIVTSRPFLSSANRSLRPPPSLSPPYPPPFLYSPWRPVTETGILSLPAVFDGLVFRPLNFLTPGLV
jgi:hypothetical protein